MSVAEKKYNVNFPYILKILDTLRYIAQKTCEGCSKEKIASLLKTCPLTIDRYISLLHKISTEKHYINYYQKKKAEDELTDKA